MYVTEKKRVTTMGKQERRAYLQADLSRISARTMQDRQYYRLIYKTSQ